MPSAPQSPMTGMMTQTGAEAQPQPTYLYDQTQLQFAQSKILKIISTFSLILFLTSYSWSYCLSEFKNNENATYRERKGFQKKYMYEIVHVTDLLSKPSLLTGYCIDIYIPFSQTFI